MRTTVTVSDGVRLAVRVHGPQDAPTLVCVHGYPDNAALWDDVRRHLPQFRVVTYDVRGAGDSDRPRRREAYRLDRLAVDRRSVIEASTPDRPMPVLPHHSRSIHASPAVARPLPR